MRKTYCVNVSELDEKWSCLALHDLTCTNPLVEEHRIDETETVYEESTIIVIILYQMG